MPADARIPEPKAPHASIKQRAAEELRRYLIFSAYLYVCFSALIGYKVALLRDAGIHYLPLGFALGKALILGKFILIGESAGIGRHLRTRTLLLRIVHRVLAMFLLLVLLSFLEELLVGWIHTRSATGELKDHFLKAWPEMLATCLIMPLILTPLIVMTELNRVLGPDTLRRLFLERTESTDAPLPAHPAQKVPPQDPESP